MERKEYPKKLEIKVGLNAFGAKCSISSITDEKGNNVYDEFHIDERIALASGEKEVILGTEIIYQIVDPSRAFSIGTCTVIKYIIK